jgi:CRP-like cAMP-binding protein
MTGNKQIPMMDKALLQDLIPLNTMTEGNLQALVEHARMRPVPAGTVLFRQGDTDKSVHYLMEGDILLEGTDGSERHVIAGSEDARYALSQLKPRQNTATAASQSTVLSFGDEVLDRLLTWDQVGGIEVVEVDTDEDSEWMMQVLRNPIFERLPAANATRMLECLEPVPVQAGQVVIRQGEPGDYYYLVRDGSCSVSQKGPDGKVAIVNELGPGDQFGEEALISNAPRNATIVMKTDGLLMRLGKKEFLELLEPPLLNWAAAPEVESVLAAGAVLLDVRTPDEFARGAIKTSHNVPLQKIHAALKSLDPARRYVVCCDTGRRSAVAAFLLSQHGFDVTALKGGLVGLQAAARKSG